LKLKSKENSTPYYLRVTINRAVADKFHEECHWQGVTVSSVITAAVIEFSQDKTDSPLMPKLTSRRERRKELNYLITRLKRVLEKERDVLFSAPTNFAQTLQCRNSEDIVTSLEQAVSTMRCTYQ
jgi:hypothetical protein